MRRRNQRLIIIAAAGALLVLAAVLVLNGLKDSVVFFVSPSEITTKAEPGRRVRLGGLVVRGSLRHEGGVVRFDVTDNMAVLPVRYDGVLPDLFREGQGVVAEGVYRPGQPFEAERVLAKHDETYMPREVAEAIKQRGEWRGPQ